MCQPHRHFKVLATPANRALASWTVYHPGDAQRIQSTDLHRRDVVRAGDFARALAFSSRSIALGTKVTLKRAYAKARTTDREDPERREQQHGCRTEQCELCSEYRAPAHWLRRYDGTRFSRRAFSAV